MTKTVVELNVIRSYPVMRAGKQRVDLSRYTPGDQLSSGTALFAADHTWVIVKEGAHDIQALAAASVRKASVVKTRSKRSSLLPSFERVAV
jgi:hypothetical protein